ncbi:hypothetical protein BGZ74_006828 [Mortierella antarctica]|nr:hypothetical protein BGZ74_006828 [Mortierella antarctica]
MSQEAPAQPSEIQRHLRPTVFGYKDIAILMRHLQKPATIEAEGLGRCLFIQAFMATAFTLWLTFDEVLQLKGEHFSIGKPSLEEPQWFYSVNVVVSFRRSDPSEANVYYRIEPQGDDFLFPYHTSDNRIQLKEPFTASVVLQLINRYASDAGLLKPKYARLDTHCFRRSGALHRLIHAQNTWHFNVVKWWGGWSENVPAEEIVRYLLDDTQDRASFGTIMSLGRNKFQGHTGAVRHALEDLIMRERVGSAIQSIEPRYMSALARIEDDRRDIRNERNGLQHAITELRNTVDLHMDTIAHALVSQGSVETRPPVTEVAPEPGQSQQPQVQSPHEQAPPPQPPPQPPRQPRQRRARVPPLQHPEQTIPEITHWKEAIRQWEKGDRANGLTLALSKWTANMKKAPQHKRSYEARKKIVEQYKVHGQDGRRMRKEYGDKMDTVGGLLTAINLRIKRQRQLRKK